MLAENGTIGCVVSVAEFFILDNEITLDVFLIEILEAVTGVFTCNVVALAIFLFELMLEVFIAIPKPPIIKTTTAPSNILLIFILLYFEI